MLKLLFSLILVNVILFGLGAGWFGFIPSETSIGAQTKIPTEFRPQSITFNKE